MRGFKIGKLTARVGVALLGAVCTAAVVIAVSGVASAGSTKATHSGPGFGRAVSHTFAHSISARRYLKQTKAAHVSVALRSPTTGGEAPPTG
jgi:hypothetical protein